MIRDCILTKDDLINMKPHLSEKGEFSVCKKTLNSIKEIDSMQLNEKITDY
jgi:hypothetical protein